MKRYYLTKRFEEIKEKAIKMCQNENLEIAPLHNIKWYGVKGVCYFGITRVIGVCRYEIDINLNMVEDEAILNTMVHELLHTIKFNDGHEGEWKKAANIINEKYHLGISRVGDDKMAHDAAHYRSTSKRWFSKAEYEEDQQNEVHYLVAYENFKDNWNNKQQSYYVKKGSRTEALILENIKNGRLTKTEAKPEAKPENKLTKEELIKTFENEGDVVVVNDEDPSKSMDEEMENKEENKGRVENMGFNVNGCVVKTDYLKELLAKNVDQREEMVKNLCWSKEWVEKYYGYNSYCVLNGLMGEIITLKWLNSNKFCKYFDINFDNLFMVTGKDKKLKLSKMSDLKLYFADNTCKNVEIKTTQRNIYPLETDKPSDYLKVPMDKALRENADLLILIDTLSLKLFVIDLKADKFIIINEDVSKIKSKALKDLTCVNSMTKLLGLKGHVVE